MRVIITLEHHFVQTPDGAIWTQVAFAYPFWTRYLSCFDRVQVIARVHRVPRVSSDWLRADGEQASFTPLPDYVGALQSLLHAREITRTLHRAFQIGDAVLLRVPSAIASALAPKLKRLNYPFGVHVVGDPYDVFAPGVVTHPLRVFWRWWFSRELRQACASAAAAAYVTQDYLQRRYPGTAFSTSFSDVELDASAFLNIPREGRAGAHPIRLITVASLAQLYKAPDVLIEAVARCRREGLDVELVVVGDGKFRAALESQAHALEGGSIHFLGQVTAGTAVRAQLDAADIFILPSRTEGLPRAMLEAMARGLPCIGSTAGGIPELLPAEDTVSPGDADALANKIREVIAAPERMARMSRRNLARANEYRMEIIAQRQSAFCRHLRESTEAWLAQRKSYPVWRESAATLREP